MPTAPRRRNGPSSVDSEREMPYSTFHLQFTNPPKGICSSFINSFLQVLFGGQALLVCERHVVFQANGKSVLSVRFALNDAARAANISYTTAGQQLCSHIFNKDFRENLSIVTRDSIVGVSAIATQWRSWFDRAFFEAKSLQGPPLLEEIGTKIADEYVPDWVIVAALTVVSGINIEPITGTAWTASRLATLATPAGVRAAKDILDSLAAFRSGKSRARLEKEYNASYAKYIRSLDKVMDRMPEFQGTGPSTSNAVVPYTGNAVSTDAELCNALFDMVKHTADMLTSNEEMLKRFYQDAGTCKAKSFVSAVGATLTGGAMKSAVAFLAEDVAVMTAAATAGMACFAIAAGAGTIYLTAKARKEHKKSKEKTEKANQLVKVRECLLQAWWVANNAEQFLIWAHCTDMAVPLADDSVDPQTRNEWTQILNIAKRNGATRAQMVEAIATHMKSRKQILRQHRQDVVDLGRKAGVMKE